MAILLSFIAGAIFWQAVCFVTMYITDDNEDAICNMALGIVQLTWALIWDIFHNIKLKYVQKNYKIYHAYSIEDKYLNSYLISNKIVNKFKDGNKDGRQLWQDIKYIAHLGLPRIKNDKDIKKENLTHCLKSEGR